MYQTMNEAVFYDFSYCTYYFYLVSNNIAATIKALYSGQGVSESYLALTNAFYTSPQAYKYCYNMINSYTDIINAYNVLVFQDYATSIYTYAANIGLNGIDIYYAGLYLL